MSRWDRHSAYRQTVTFTPHFLTTPTIAISIFILSLPNNDMFISQSLFHDFFRSGNTEIFINYLLSQINAMGRWRFSNDMITFTWMFFDILEHGDTHWHFPFWSMVIRTDTFHSGAWWYALTLSILEHGDTHWHFPFWGMVIRTDTFHSGAWWYALTLSILEHGDTHWHFPFWGMVIRTDTFHYGAWWYALTLSILEHGDTHWLFPFWSMVIRTDTFHSRAWWYALTLSIMEHGDTHWHFPF